MDEARGRNQSWPTSRYCPEICVAVVRKLRKQLNQDSRRPGRNSNEAPSEYNYRLDRRGWSSFLTSIMTLFRHVDNLSLTFAFMVCYWNCYLHNVSLCCQHRNMNESVQLFLCNTSSASLSLLSLCWQYVYLTASGGLVKECPPVHSRCYSVLACIYLLWWELWHDLFRKLLEQASHCFSTPLVFNLRYAYFGGYAKTSHGVCKIEKKKSWWTLNNQGQI
jgi:hypothetical protein